MGHHRIRFSHAAVLALTSTLVAQQTKPENGPQKKQAPELVANLTAENFAAWRDHIRSKPAERDWATLPWKMTFHEGLVAAAKAKKPLLLWVMNGHPFGCT